MLVGIPGDVETFFGWQQRFGRPEANRCARSANFSVASIMQRPPADSPNQVHLQSGFLSRLAALDQVLARPTQTLLPDTLSNIAVPDEREVK